MHALADPSLVLESLLVWSAQVTLLAAAGWLASLAIQHPKTRLAMWQGVLLLALLLPAIEPWRVAPALPIAMGMTSVDATPVVVAAASQATFHWRVEYWLWLLAAGAAIRMGLVLAGFARLRRYRRQAQPLPAPPLRFASAVASWYASDAVSGPVTYGWRQPVILLPSRVIELPAELSEAIQCHELIHVRRGDWLWVLGETIVRGLFWFHPAIWFLASRIQLAREQVVDQEAVSLLQNRERYLEALVAVASFGLKSGPRYTELAPAFLRKRHLVARVKAVAKEIPMSRSRIAAGIAAASSVVSVAALAAMWLFPFTGAPKVEAQTAPDSPGVTVDAGAPLLHRAPVRAPQGASGTVVVQASIDAKGEVSDARVVSGPDELRKAALTSVLQWHYAPGPSTAQASIQFTAPATAPAAPIAVAVQVPPPPPPPPPAPGTAVRSAEPVFAVAGGRGPAPAQPRPPAFPAQVKSIQFQGLSQEAEQQLRSRLTVREGDTITQEDFTAFSNAVRAFDGHLFTMTSRPEPGQVTLQVRVMPEAAPATQGAVRESSGVASNKLIKQVPPVYPPIAKQARIQGSVALSALIATDGTVKQLTVVSSTNPLLTPAAMEAVKQWIYQPTILNGQPTEVSTEVTVDFSLQ